MIEKLAGSGITPEFITFVISALPVAESRVSLPLAINLFGLPWYQAVAPAIIGNLLPVPLLLLFFGSLGRFLGRWKYSRPVSRWFVQRVERRAEAIEKYGTIGLLVFVAVPFPGTGAWTGAMAASLMRLGFRRSFLAITGGVIASAAIITALSLAGWTGAVIAGVSLVSLAVLYFRKR
ncbi:MAG: small multi-drug export [Dehalococcoidia bacterium]|nr:MAG: small multi-drug export [Dehalococcoidia bacterium]